MPLDWVFRWNGAQCKPKETNADGLCIYFTLAMTVMGEKRKKKQVLRLSEKWWGCLLKTRMHGPIGEEHEFFYKAIGQIMTKFLQPVELEPRAGIRPQEEGIGCKSRTVRPKISNLMDTTMAFNVGHMKAIAGKSCARASEGADASRDKKIGLSSLAT
jgi:hypothetical protein